MSKIPQVILIFFYLSIVQITAFWSHDCKYSSYPFKYSINTESEEIYFIHIIFIWIWKIKYFSPPPQKKETTRFTIELNEDCWLYYMHINSLNSALKHAAGLPSKSLYTINFSASRRWNWKKFTVEQVAICTDEKIDTFHNFVNTFKNKEWT